MPDESLQALKRKLEDLVGPNQDYRSFLEAVKNAGDLISQLNTRDRYGRYPVMSAQDRMRLMRLHREIGMKAEDVIRGEDDKQRKDLVKKITSLAAGHHRALMNYDPEKRPKTLPTLLSELRTLNLDTRGAALRSKLSNPVNARQPITFLDDKGREITGVFTPKTHMNVRGSIQRKLQEIRSQVRNPAGLQILDKFLEKATAWGAGKENTDLSAWPEDRKLALLKPLLEQIGSGDRRNQLDRSRMKTVMEEIFAEELQGASITSKIPKKLLWELGQTLCDQSVNIDVKLRSGGIPDGVRLDNRNAAMSAVADLLGVPNLTARSRPMKLIMPDGTEAEGTFMAEARGMDTRNLSEQAANIDKNAVMGSDEDELAAIGKGFKDLADLQVLDFLCGNVDRSSANLLYSFTPGHKFCGCQGICNDSALGLTDPKEDQPEKELAALRDMKVISASMYKAVKDLTPETLRFCLQGFGLSEGELEAASKRLKTLQQKLEADRASYERVPKNELLEGRIRIVENKDWAELNLNQLAVLDKDRSPKNIFAQARAAIYPMARDYANQREACRSLRSEIAVGSDNRAKPAGLAQNAATAEKLAELLNQRTTQGKSTPQYDAMQKAVEDYARFQIQLQARMEQAAGDQRDPDAALERVVSSRDLEQMRLLGQRMEQTAQTCLSGIGAGPHFGYTARRVEAARMALDFGKKAAQLSDAELQSAERNEKSAMAELRRRAGDSPAEAELKIPENPFFAAGKAQALAPQAGH